MNDFSRFQPYHSPLFMVMNDPVLHQFISYLTEKKLEQEATPHVHFRIELPRELIERVRESFRKHILDGELNLHLVSHLLSSTFLGNDFELHSNVIGVLPGGESRPFLIRERITREMLFSRTDIDLGNEMLRNFQYHGREGWEHLALSANFIEYLPLNPTGHKVNRITSRVKAEEELWNKVTDELFGLDDLIRRDKQLQQFSKYIKDVFGIKIVCEDEQSCLVVHEKLQELTTADCDPAGLSSIIGPVAAGNIERSSDALLEFVEIKNYLTCEPERMKKTGWRALKSVVRWQNQLFEIQVQPLANYYLELDHMSGPSHRSFKLLRDTLRLQLARRIPLFGFYRDLLKMLFLDTAMSFDYENASVVIIEDQQ